VGARDDTDARLDCLRTCAERLPHEDRRLVLEYYLEEGHEQQQLRRTLADRLGISLTALRLRVFRIRRLLEVCTRGCVNGYGAAPVRRGAER
jgi:DNA-directed RNA polymerase specialized sigma24 family protein